MGDRLDPAAFAEAFVALAVFFDALEDFRAGKDVGGSFRASASTGVR